MESSFRWPGHVLQPLYKELKCYLYMVLRGWLIKTWKDVFISDILGWRIMNYLPIRRDDRRSRSQKATPHTGDKASELKSQNGLDT